MDECDCLEDFYGWVLLFTAHLWVGYCLEHFYGLVWVGETGCGLVSMGVDGCGWVGKMVKLICFLIQKHVFVHFLNNQKTIHIT